MSIFNSLIFDDINSLDYGVYITGEAVYDAPERDVEVVSVPGRNGDIIIDNGRYKNIKVTYHCGIFGADQNEFASKIRKFRNALASRGSEYKQIADSYNIDEYRKGAYIAPTEVESTSMNRVGNFDVIFNCMPQRFLLSGEDSIAVSSGDIIYNPTPKASSPLIAVEGPGLINLGDQPIQINDVVVGTVRVSDKITLQNQDLVRTWNINDSKYNPGDLVTIDGLTLKSTFTITNSAIFLDSKNDRTMGIEYYNSPDTDATLTYNKSGKTATFGVTIAPFTLTIGQDLSKTYKVRSTVIVDNGDRWQSQRLTSTYSFSYTNGVLTVSADTMIFNTNGALSIAAPREASTITLGAIVGESTLSTLTDTIYLDCEIGDAYVLKDGEYVSLNSTVEFGSDLPVLPSGETEVTYEDTITALSITPRWWIL